MSRRQAYDPQPVASLGEDALIALLTKGLDSAPEVLTGPGDDCAVLGRRGPVEAIEVMAGKHLGMGDVRPVLDSLEAKDLLVLSGSGERETWTFRSDLVREVAYSTLTKADRARSHAGIALLRLDPDLRRPPASDRLPKPLPGKACDRRGNRPVQDPAALCVHRAASAPDWP